jgi:hypothetical protein
MEQYKNICPFNVLGSFLNEIATEVNPVPRSVETALYALFKQQVRQFQVNL